MVEDAYKLDQLLIKEASKQTVLSEIPPFITEHKQHMDTLREGLRLFDTHIEEHVSHINNGWSDITETYAVLEKTLQDISGNSEQPISLATSQSLHQVIMQHAENLSKLDVVMKSLADIHTNEMISSFRSTQWNIVLFLIIAVPFTLLIPILVTKIITNPLVDLQNNMKSLISGSGNLNSLLPDEKGEAGEVATLYNQLIIKLRVSLLQVLEVASLLGNASRQLQTNAEHTRVGLVGQEAEVTDVITSMQNLESEINSIGDITKIAADVATQTQSKTSSGQDLMNTTVEVIKKLNKDSIESAEKIERVVESANYIGTVTGVINEIAEQTNLLALNAAIEAARAGEQGRGFAVVADEVRKLALRTQNSVGEINTIIEELKSNILVSQQAMNANQESANAAQDSINEMSASLREIGGSNNKIADMNQEIVEAITRQVELASGINRNTVNLQSTTKQAESNAISMENLSEKLTELVARLDITAETFNLQDHLDQSERDMIDTYSNKKELMHDDDKYKNDDVELF